MTSRAVRISLVVVLGLLVMFALLAYRSVRRPSDERAAAAIETLAIYLHTDYSGRAGLVTPNSLANRWAHYPPVLFMSARELDAAQRPGYVDGVTMDVFFLGSPFSASFDIVETPGGKWLVSGQGAG